MVTKYSFMAGFCGLFLLFMFLMFFNFRLFVLSFILFLMTFRFFVVYRTLPPQIELLPVFVSMASVLLILKNTPSKSFLTRSGVKEIFIPMLGFLFIFILSSLLNNANGFEILISFAWFFYGVIFLAAVLTSQSADYYLFKKTTSLILMVLIVQIPLQILQAFPSPLFLSKNPDYVFGTFGFGGTSLIATFLLALSYLFIMRFLFKKTNILILLSVLIIVIISSYLASIPYLRVGLLISPIIYFLIFRLKVNRRKLNLVSISSLAAFLIIMGFSNIYIAEELEMKGRITSFGGTDLFDWDNVKSYMIAGGMSDEGLKVGRIMGLALSVNAITSKDFKTLLFGFGPGSTRSKQSVAFSGAKKEHRATPQVNFFGLDKLLVEFGILGCFAFFYILGNIFFNIRKWLVKTKDIRIKQLGAMYLAILFLFVLTFQYDGGWSTPYQKVIPFWFFTAMIYKLRALSYLPVFQSENIA